MGYKEKKDMKSFLNRTLSFLCATMIFLTGTVLSGLAPVITKIKASGEITYLSEKVDVPKVNAGPGGDNTYNVIKHEGGEVVTPRLEFHFLSEQFTEDSEQPGTYIAGPFSFINKAGTYQNSEIVKNGETLELIMNPPNLEFTEDDPTDPGHTVTISKYFFGWYIVDASSKDNSGNTSYVWTAEPEQLVFEKAVTIDSSKVEWEDENHYAIKSLVWELNGVEHTVSASDNTDSRVVLDEFGCAHVYVAPIYQDYYFVNYHAGIEGTDLGNSILMRRLVVLGSDETAEVRIGDVQASSADARRKIFTGWEADLWEEVSQSVARQQMTTLDEVGEEYNTSEDKDGFYITVTSHDLYQGKNSIDLYPIFTETRWFHFRTGASGNGATYVGDSYLYTTDQPSDVENGTARYYLTDLPTSTRLGYTFKGWFADANETDSNGDYIDGIQISDENGHVVNSAFTKYAADGITPLYQMKDGRLYAYKDVDPEAGVTLYAHWEEVTKTNIQVIVWRQKISDSKNAYDHQKTYDFEAAYTIENVASGMTLADLRANDFINSYEEYNNTGFHWRVTEMSTAKVRGDGSTVVNVYYDRDLMTIYFYYNGSGGEPAYTYTPTTGNNTPQYGIVEGEYVELVRKQGSGMKYIFRYDYQRTTSDTIEPQFALVSHTGGVKLYEQLTLSSETVSNTRWRFRTGGILTGTNRYMDQGKTNDVFYVLNGRRYRASDYTTSNPPPANDGETYYCKYNNRYYELTPQTTTTTTYVWKLDGNVFTGTRYRRLSGSAEYTGDKYTVSGHSGETFGIDSNGGYVELVGTAIAEYQWFTKTHVEDYFKDNENDGTQRDVYGLVDGNYVKLTPVFGNNYTYRTSNTYTASTDSDALYGLVDGEYVELTRHQDYTYNRTGYTYTRTMNNSGTQYGIVNGVIQQVYYRNDRWRTTNRNNGSVYNGYRYTLSNSDNNAYEGTLYVVSSGTAGNNESGFEPTDLETGNNLYGKDGNTYFQLQVTETTYYTYKDAAGNDQTYTGTRYEKGDGAAWTGSRYTRSGENAPYTYTLYTDDPTTGMALYIVDDNGGYVKLNWTVDVSGYTYDDANGVAQPYTGDRYSYTTGGIETEYTGTRYTREQNSRFNSMITYTGLYGQTLAYNGYTWPSSIPGQNGTWWWYDGYTTSYGGGMSGSGTRTTFLEAFLFPGDGDVATFYGFTNSGSTHIYFYQEQLDGSWALTEDVTSGTGSFYISDKYTGFQAYQYSKNGTTWNSAGSKNGNGYYNNGTAVTNYTELHIRFRRLSYDLIFDPNYPTKAGTTVGGTEVTLENIASLTESNTEKHQVPYEKALSAYRNQPQPAQGPDNYTFTGWYIDETCTQKYNFGEPMPAANMRLYAGWKAIEFLIKIDPNGAEFDHIDHRYDMNNSSNPARQGYGGWFWDSDGNAVEYVAGMDVSGLTPFATFNRGEILAENGTVERPADNGWAATSRYSTYINVTYLEPVTEYTEMRCDYIPVSDAFAANYNGAIYYYMNAQYQSQAIDGSGIPSANRNALYLTEEELHQYYLFYYDWMDGNIIGNHITGAVILDEETWRETYVSKQKYRHTIGSEHYTFIGWYKLDDDGNPESMPYNFSDPVTESFTLRAYWRLDAGYQIRYHADYTMDDGVIINGQIPYWTDPEVQTSRYADEAGTHIYRQPTGITANNQPTTEYIFRGWQLVNISQNSQGQVVYTPIESEVYYDPGDDFIVHSAYADRASCIHMQAVYEEKNSSYRRPYITNLKLNANGGFITLDGQNELNTNTDITSTWPGVIGTISATVDDNGSDTELIEFINIQSNEKARLYRYATDIDHIDGDDNKAELNPAGKNYFKHPDNYFLLGFDDASNEGDYIATHPADSAIAVPRNESQTVYAVWEPLVYIKVVNETDVGPVTFGLSSSEGALQVVNAREGLYGRTPMTAEQMSAITVEKDDYVWLAVPYGVVKEIVEGNEVWTKRHVTLEGTNTLGPGWLLTATSTLDGQNRETLSGSLTNSNADYVSVKNQTRFGFNEQLEINPEGVVITFTATQNPHTLVLDDNYPTIGVRTQEIYFDKQDNASSTHGYDIVYGEEKRLYYDLPTTSTRIGYIFLGWDPDPNWVDHHDVETEKPAFTTDGATGWRINNLNSFFVEGTELASVKTLYAVWDTSAESKIVYVYKEVPEPGDPDKDFTFTVSLSGKYDYTKYESGWFGGSTSNHDNNSFTATGNGVFTLKNAEYLRIESSKVDSGSGSWTPSIKTTIEKYDESGVLQSSSVLSWSWNNSVSSAGTYRSFTFHDLQYSVTETDYSADPHYYDTTMACTALASDTYPLKLDTTVTSISALPVKDVAGRVLSWTDTEAGGRVIFTNTRQTANIKIKKNLVSSSSVTGIFNFTAAYNLDGIDMNLGSFTVTSGTEGTELTKIPVGAQLTVTELGANLNDYTTTVKIGSTTAAVVEAEESVSGVTTYKRQVKYDVAKGDTTITYTNTLKSYPITFYKVDQDGKAGVPSYFRLNSSTGLIAEQLYPAQTGKGEFFPGATGIDNRFYIGTYTVTETFVGSNYLPLEEPITLTLSSADGGKLESSNTDYVVIQKVKDDDPSKGFKVTIYNQKIVTMTVRKILSDPILTSTRAFNFRVQYEYELLGKTVSYDNYDTTKPNNGLLSIRSGMESQIKVPVNAKLTVSEVLSETDEATYDTNIVRSYQDGSTTKSDEKVDGRVYTYGSEAGSNHGIVLAENDGDVLTFTNTRQVVNVTVKKRIENYDLTNPDDNKFTFKATLLNGGYAIPDYPIDLNGTPDDSSDDVNTVSDGTYDFELQHNDEKTLSIPRGARLTIQEISASNGNIESYSADVKAVYTDDGVTYSGGRFTDDAKLYDLNPVPVKALTVTFTNGPAGKTVMFKKVDGFGNALAGARFSLYSDYSCSVSSLVTLTVNETKSTTATSTGAFSTAENGVVYNVNFKVANGIFYMKETNTVNGYLPNSSVYRVIVGTGAASNAGVTLPADSEYLIQRMTDATTVDDAVDIVKNGIMNISDLQRKAIIRKVDLSGKPLDAVTVEIHSADLAKMPFGALHLDESNQYGTLFVGMLPYGTYYLHELNVPSGYQKLPTGDNWFRLTVDKDGVNAPVRMTEAETAGFPH